jgi:hypothetical protein
MESVKKLSVPTSLVFPSSLLNIMNKLELIERLRQVDEITLLEALEITSDDLIDAFMDKVNEKLEDLYRQVQD